MLGTFLEKLNTLFDRRLVIAYWSPTFIVSGLAGALIAAILGPGFVLDCWARRGPTQQLILAFGALLSITILAYILQAFTAPIVRLFGGYWPNGKLSAWGCARQRLRMKDASETQLYNCFPVNIGLIKPTRLGNVLIAAEDYPRQLYRLDAVLWWPRLTATLPETLRTQIDAALTPMLAMLNLSLTLMLLAIATSGTLVWVHRWWWQLCSVLIAELLLSRVCYLAATLQAEEYGAMIRVAFDLCRLDLLKQMHIPLPDNLFHERLLWEALNRWVYSYVPPWQISAISDAVIPQDPFFNDTHTSPPATSRAQEIIVTLVRDTKHPGE